MKVITSYGEPDIDGVSGIYAYSELLTRLGEETDYFIWGVPRTEVSIVCEKFKISLGGLKEIDGKNDIVLIDLNSYDQVYEKIKRDDVVEIIDHHGISKTLNEYQRLSRVQIDRIGAAATIVAERYKASGLIPSREAAILLYFGIISNSINLKANITSKRDIDATEWLKSICPEIKEEYIEEIFKEKSKISDEKLRPEMECELPMNTHDKKVLVGQLEICNVDNFIEEKKELIDKILNEVQEEKNVNFLFINMVDILNGFSEIYTLSDDSRKLVNNLLGLEFDGNIAKFDGLVQRKEITKAIRDYDGELEF